MKKEQSSLQVQQLDAQYNNVRQLKLFFPGCRSIRVMAEGSYYNDYEKITIDQEQNSHFQHYKSAI